LRIIAVLVALIMSVSTVSAQSQEDTFVLQDFALAKGMSDSQFVKANMMVLSFVAKQLNANPKLHAEITAWADATQFTLHHDQLNAATATSRYNVVVGILVDSLGVDPQQLEAMRPRESSLKGGQYRKVEIRIHEPPVYVTQWALDSLGQELRAEIRNQQRSNITNVSNFFFSIAEIKIGISSHVYGNIIPVIVGRLGNQTLSFEATFGNSIFTKEKTFAKERLHVSYTLVSGNARYRPWNHPIDLIAGWQRLQERSTAYGRYTRKSSGPILGITWYPFTHVSFLGMWTPAEEDTFGVNRVAWHYNRFQVAVIVSKLWEK